MSQQRSTKQKKFVLEFLKNTFNHPTVSQILEFAHKEGIRIGEASIYRILTNLVEEGKICKIVTKDNIAHYDYNRNNHIHLVCNICNNIIDTKVDEKFDENLKTLLQGFQLSKQDITFFGECENCKNKKTTI